MKLNECWAKLQPYQKITTHAYITGRISQYVYRYVISSGERSLIQQLLNENEEETCSFIGYLASLHDIGKVEGKFQQKNTDIHSQLKEEGIFQFIPAGEKIRHEITTKWVMESIWKGSGMDRGTVRFLSPILRAHHQGKEGHKGNWRAEPWKILQRELEQNMRKRFTEMDLSQIHVGTENGALAAALLGIIILSDWIASSDVFSDADTWIQAEDAEERIKGRIHRFLEKSGLLPVRIEWGNRFCDLWPCIPRKGVRPLQEAVESFFSEEDKKVEAMLIEAPMGEGKTEAGLYAAIAMMKQWRKDGIYVALPTAATSNQMVERIRDFLDMHGSKSKVRLLHAMAWITDRIDLSDQEEEPNDLENWLAPTRLALLGQYSVGTIDQAMLAATNAKYGVLRLLGLSNKVLIIDEIHSYDVYMTEIILTLLAWCKALEIPVIMLSATLPPMLKQKLLSPYTTKALPQAYPSITAITRSDELVVRPVQKTVRRQQVNIKTLPILNHSDQIAALAVEQSRKNGCICVMMNTVKEAQMVYQEIKKQYDGDLLLFHAQFPLEQRDKIEKKCLEKYGKDKSKRPKCSIVVTTQVVEQSLDVDFDLMITAIAPIDLVIQRMGRVFRHDHTPRPEAYKIAEQWILIPENGEHFGASEYVYPKCLLLRAMDLLTERDQIQIPEDLTELVKAGYDPDWSKPEEAEAWLAMMIEDGEKASASGKYLLAPPEQGFTPCIEDPVFRDDGENGYLSVQTRLGEASCRIALVDLETHKELLKKTCVVNGKHSLRLCNPEMARLLTEKSVSLSKRRVKKILEAAGDLPIYTSGLLNGAIILPGEKEGYENAGGKIVFDPHLGVMIQEKGEKDGKF